MTISVYLEAAVGEHACWALDAGALGCGEDRQKARRCVEGEGHGGKGRVHLALDGMQTGLCDGAERVHRR
jgi:hypothetical protein